MLSSMLGRAVLSDAQPASTHVFEYNTLDVAICQRRLTTPDECPSTPPGNPHVGSVRAS